MVEIFYLWYSKTKYQKVGLTRKLPDPCKKNISIVWNIKKIVLKLINIDWKMIENIGQLLLIFCIFICYDFRVGNLQIVYMQ